MAADGEPRASGPLAGIAALWCVAGGLGLSAPDAGPAGTGELDSGVAGVAASGAAGLAAQGAGLASDGASVSAVARPWNASASKNAATTPAASASHPFRLSVADAEVAGDTLRARIRFFWDDLELAMMEHTSDMAFRLQETPRVDSIVFRYIDQMLAIEVGGQRLAATFQDRGIDDATLIDEVMWWYRLEYRLPTGAERIAIRNRLLFNLFEDQRNVVHLKTRSGRERAYAFGWSKDSAAASLN